MKPRIFDNKVVTALMKEYASSKRHRRVLRDKIMDLALPLIKAAISKKRLYKYKEDLEQECAIRVLQALPKFKPKRGDAFGFLWATICNTCITQNQKLMSKRGYSLSDDQTLREAESTSLSKDDPAKAHVLKSIAKKTEQALSLETFGTVMHQQRKRVFRYIKKSITNEDLFYSKDKVLKRLKNMGLTKKEATLCIDHVLIFVRDKLYQQVEEAHAVQEKRIGKIGSRLSEIVSE